MQSRSRLLRLRPDKAPRDRREERLRLLLLLHRTLHSVIGPLKLYREGEEFERNKQFDEALTRYNMAAAIIESGLPPERWMVDLYFTRASHYGPTSDKSKRDYTFVIDDYT